MDKIVIGKEAIIAEYLSSEITFRELEKIYGVDFKNHTFVGKKI
jgi:hypothetical protein